MKTLAHFSIVIVGNVTATFIEVNAASVFFGQTEVAVNHHATTVGGGEPFEYFLKCITLYMRVTDMDSVPSGVKNG